MYAFNCEHTAPATRLRVFRDATGRCKADACTREKGPQVPVKYPRLHLSLLVDLLYHLKVHQVPHHQLVYGFQAGTRRNLYVSRVSDDIIRCFVPHNSHQSMSTEQWKLRRPGSVMQAGIGGVSLRKEQQHAIRRSTGP